MKTICIIPARYASTRLPGKPLRLIAGEPMIQRVYEQAKKATKVQKVVVATDDQRVFDAVKNFGGEVVMTSTEHRSGTDRLAEAVQNYADVDVVVNVQGDEPMIPPEIIDRLAQAFDEDENLQMATMKCPMAEDEYQDPAAVKVVTDVHDFALYFSRSLVPYPRNKEGFKVYKHVGIYAYRKDFLMKFACMAPTNLEMVESLEQLRVLENGYKIKVLASDFRGVGVDTPEDLAKVNEIFAERK